MNQYWYDKLKKFFLQFLFLSIKMENAEDEEEEEREEGEDNDDLINDILTSEEEEEEETTTIRKTKLVPIDAIDDTDQETIRLLSFNERTKSTTDSSTISSSRSHNKNQIIKTNDSRIRKINDDDDDDRRINIRRAPRGRMNSRRNEP